MENQASEIRKNTNLIIFEWISIIGVFIVCFSYLANKIDKQSERTDRLYEMFVSAQKETKDMFIEMLKDR